jgi:hypothetical protein
VVEHHDLSTTFARFNGAHQASCAGTDDQNVCVNGFGWHILLTAVSMMRHFLQHLFREDGSLDVYNNKSASIR